MTNKWLWQCQDCDALTDEHMCYGCGSSNIDVANACAACGDQPTFMEGYEHCEDCLIAFYVKHPDEFFDVAHMFYSKAEKKLANKIRAVLREHGVAA